MEHAYSLIIQADQEMLQMWLQYTVFAWQWWLGVSLSILPWVIWIIFRKKDSSDRLLLAGFFVMLIASWFDLLGICHGRWSYYMNVVPVSPAFVPWDFTLLPVVIMLTIQIKPHLSPVIKALFITLFSSFVVEPFFVWIGLYNPKHWEYIYSVPILFVIYLIAHWLAHRSGFERLESY